MLILPHTNPLYENISAKKVHLPEAMKKLGAGGFTGYMGYGSTSAEGYFIFIKGAMISALMLEGAKRKTGFEAINSLFNNTVTEGGTINVFRMAPELAVCTHALLHGDVVLKPELVSTVELKSVLARMKALSLNGTVLFSTPDRSAMIFFKEGGAVGFYNDAAQDIDSDPLESQRVAALPGALIEIRGTTPIDDLLHHNFLESINMERLWQTTQSRLAGRQPQPVLPPATPVAPQPVTASQNEELLKAIVEDLQEIASAYLSRQGVALVDRLLEASGGMETLLSEQKVAIFLTDMTGQAPDIDPEAKIDEMVDLMRSEIARRLSL
jgi:hypothetical protein